MLTMELYDPIPFVPPLRPTDIVAAARAVYEEMDTRRSVRTFSDEAVAREAVVYAIRAASTRKSLDEIMVEVAGPTT